MLYYKHKKQTKNLISSLKIKYRDSDNPFLLSLKDIGIKIKRINMKENSFYSKKELVSLIESKIKYEESYEVSEHEGMNEFEKRAMIGGMNYILEIVKNPQKYDDNIIKFKN